MNSDERKRTTKHNKLHKNQTDLEPTKTNFEHPEGRHCLVVGPTESIRGRFPKTCLPPPPGQIKARPARTTATKHKRAVISTRFISPTHIKTRTRHVPAEDPARPRKKKEINKVYSRFYGKNHTAASLARFPRLLPYSCPLLHRTRRAWLLPAFACVCGGCKPQLQQAVFRQNSDSSLCAAPEVTRMTDSSFQKTPRPPPKHSSH